MGPNSLKCSHLGGWLDRARHYSAHNGADTRGRGRRANPPVIATPHSGQCVGLTLGSARGAISAATAVYPTTPEGAIFCGACCRRFFIARTTTPPIMSAMSRKKQMSKKPANVSAVDDMSHLGLRCGAVPLVFGAPAYMSLGGSRVSARRPFSLRRRKRRERLQAGRDQELKAANSARISSSICSTSSTVLAISSRSSSR